MVEYLSVISKVLGLIPRTTKTLKQNNHATKETSWKGEMTLPSCNAPSFILTGHHPVFLMGLGGHFLYQLLLETTSGPDCRLESYFTPIMVKWIVQAGLRV